MRETTQDPDALRSSAKLAIVSTFERYVQKTVILQPEPEQIEIISQERKRRRRMNVVPASQTELTLYLQEPLIDEEAGPLNYWKQ